MLTRRDVRTTLTHISGTSDSQAPYSYTYTPPPNIPESNILHTSYPIMIRDVRGLGDTVASLDASGFEFIHAPTRLSVRDFGDINIISAVYYREIEELLKKVTGGKKVVIFDSTIRDPPSASGKPVDLNKPHRGPVMTVHVDQTFEAGYARARRHAGTDATRLLTGRVRIINVWRPVGHPVAHHPLAVCDWRSIDPEHDLVSSRHIFRDREGTTFAVRYNPSHRWWYLSDQTPDEVTLIKCFDSERGVARLSPHSAFLDGTSPSHAPDRRSIEVRCLVFDLE